ncbi:hypothetical protein [Vibrio metschnikovii]|uniref:hypothetical protein n=1 Tax=Vibrio metschnikovii TaxID=28172 RepID=UPI001C308DF0|nr:hypothetical protein [Vibrio metschnikovii]
MKVSRSKVFVFLLIFASIFFLSINDVMGIFDVYTLSNDRIVISGAINDASTFAFSWSMFVMTILMSICFFTGKKLLWIPKIVLIFLGGIAVLAFFLGWGMNVTLKEKLYDQGYIECTSERELTLKYSNRTYALDPSLCD